MVVVVNVFNKIGTKVFVVFQAVFKTDPFDPNPPVLTPLFVILVPAFSYRFLHCFVGAGSTPLHYAACGGNLKCCQLNFTLFLNPQ